MGFVDNTVKAIGGALSGQGPSSLDPNNVNAAAFTDPNREANKNILEMQRQAQLAQGNTGAANDAQSRTAQMGLINSLQAQASGQAPSIAELQLMKSNDQSRQALASQAASMPGGQAGLAQRNLLRTQAATNQQTNQDAAILRAQEQQSANTQLAGALNQTRTLDQASQQQANTLALQYMQLGLSLDQAQFLANQELEKVKTGQATAQAQIGQQQQGAIIGAGGSLGAAALLSDKTQKKDIKDSEKDVSKFLKALSSKSYDYKDGKMAGAAEGRRYGIIAQDLEKTPMGKSLVIDGPNGKMIDSIQTIGALLSSVSSLNKRLEKVGA